MNDPEAVADLKADEERIKIRLDKRELTETKSEIKAIYLQMLQMQGEMMIKLDQVQVANAEQANQLMLVENTKILDHIFIKYGLKLPHLQAAIE